MGIWTKCRLLPAKMSTQTGQIDRSKSVEMSTPLTLRLFLRDSYIENPIRVVARNSVPNPQQVGQPIWLSTATGQEPGLRRIENFRRVDKKGVT